ncbi:MAG: phosphodiester glycosidase family protein [Bacteroidota bacterium]
MQTEPSPSPSSPAKLQWMFWLGIGLIVLLLILLVINIIKGPNQAIADDKQPATVTLPDPPKVSSPSPSTASSTASAPLPQTAAQSFTHLNQAFTAFILDLTQHEVTFAPAPTNTFQTITDLKTKIEQKGQALQFATNAGIFKKNGRPEGLFVSQGKTISPLNLKDGNGNFYMKPNGVFYITTAGKAGILESQEYQDQHPEVAFATQSGPLLMQNGDIHPALRQGSKNLRLRSGVGILSSQQAVFVISQKPVNFYDFTDVFHQHYGCQDILYLDGVISEMYVPDLGLTKTGQDFSGIIAVVKEE